MISARYPHWKMRLEIVYDKNHFSQEDIRRHLELAGSKIGMGFRRPENGWPFGTFKIDDKEK